MEKIDKKQGAIIAIISIVLLVFVTKFYNDLTQSRQHSTVPQENIQKIEKIDALDQKDNIEIEDIYVHVCGRVKNPGLIKIKSDARVMDAINLAGGMYEDADMDNINLAKKLQDEDRIYIPKIGENKKSDFIGEKDKININTANQTELMSLPGIGEKTAQKIINYREENSFSTIEDLKSVPGFGDKKLNELKNFITVN